MRLELGSRKNAGATGSHDRYSPSGNVLGPCANIEYSLAYGQRVQWALLESKLLDEAVYVWQVSKGHPTPILGHCKRIILRLVGEVAAFRSDPKPMSTVASVIVAKGQPLMRGVYTEVIWSSREAKAENPGAYG